MISIEFCSDFHQIRDIFFLQLPSSQKYIYTWSILKILDVLKSYDSETFISGVLDPAEQDYDTPWYPFFRRFLENLQKQHNIPSAPPY